MLLRRCGFFSPHPLQRATLPTLSPMVTWPHSQSDRFSGTLFSVLQTYACRAYVPPIQPNNLRPNWSAGLSRLTIQVDVSAK
ncbi:unnamed protein product [Hymenolepis diminuta]|uniref:Secreted protein n=1 Tax=Hymenolepis diminuta TaxID=6216 RepID=A0A0R3SQ87_HYMDI|nr:unnamed protein product [Hymenolepis diminuta]